MEPKLTRKIDIDRANKWKLNGKLHREDGPAYEHPSGFKSWYFNDERHRIGGPAIECPDGSKSWWLDGMDYSEEAYWKELFKRGLITEKELFLKLL